MMDLFVPARVLVVDVCFFFLFFFQAEDGIRDRTVTGVQTCALPIWRRPRLRDPAGARAQHAPCPPRRQRRCPPAQRPRDPPSRPCLCLCLCPLPLPLPDRKSVV